MRNTPISDRLNAIRRMQAIIETNDAKTTANDANTKGR
jgi:hypothetical protein